MSWAGALHHRKTILPRKYMSPLQIQLSLYTYLSAEFIGTATIYNAIRRVGTVLQLMHMLKYYYWVINPAESSGITPEGLGESLLTSWICFDAAERSGSAPIPVWFHEPAIKESPWNDNHSSMFKMIPNWSACLSAFRIAAIYWRWQWGRHNTSIISSPQVTGAGVSTGSLNPVLWLTGEFAVRGSWKYDFLCCCYFVIVYVII